MHKARNCNLYQINNRVLKNTYKRTPHSHPKRPSLLVGGQLHILILSGKIDCEHFSTTSASLAADSAPSPRSESTIDSHHYLPWLCSSPVILSPAVFLFFGYIQNRHVLSAAALSTIILPGFQMRPFNIINGQSILISKCMSEAANGANGKILVQKPPNMTLKIFFDTENI